MASHARRVVALGALTSMACSILVDTNGLTGGTPDAGAPKGANTDDGGSVSRDASPGKGDGGGGEAGTPASGGCDGNTDFLCADFDHGAVDDGWGEMRVTGNGTVAFGDAFVSAPRSFRATTPSGPGEKQARLIADVPSLSPQRAIASMQMMLCDANGSNFELVKLQEATNGGGIKIFHGGERGQVQIDLRSRPSQSYDFPPLPTGRWIHVVIDAHYDSLNGSVSITVDEAVVLDQQDIPTLVDPITAFFVGQWTDLPANACTAQFDDVRLRFEP